MQKSNIPDDTLINIQKNLYALKNFLDQNPQLFHSTPGDTAGARTAPINEQEAWRVSLFREIAMTTITNFF